MIARKGINSVIIMILVVAFLSGMTQISFASAPQKESVKYKGSGLVEVDFVSNVKYKNTKVTVKDSSGKKYKATIIERDNDEIKFRVKKYKAGKKYNFVIKGIKEAGTSKYGKVKGKFYIPKKSTKVSAKKAKKIAIDHAVKKYGIKRSSVSDLDIEKDYYGGKIVWEISFDARRKGKECEYEYKIRISNGEILYCEEEWDD